VRPSGKLTQGRRGTPSEGNPMKAYKTIAGVVCVALMLSMGVLFTPGSRVLAHCQIPCGIYNDQMRVVMLQEHITTIKKSMDQINELSKDPAANANQLTRWVMNKEDHADAFAEIVTKYFLQQRVKPTDARSGKEWDGYVEKIRLCHEMLVATMKAKQTTDLQYVDQLSTLVEDFKKAYFSAEDLATMKAHGH
jgi:nickel superoxide dismutase